MSQIEEWIDDPEFEKLRTMITLKDNAMISCACVCCIHNFSAGDEMENYELCTQIWVCGYTHSCNQMDLKAKVEVFVYKDGQTKRHCDSFDMVR